MRSMSLFCVLAFLCGSLNAQVKQTYTITADSVKITNCDSSELIIENHTQGVHGFLFNTGNGRTFFKRGAQKINDSLYLVGADTIRTQSNAWVQGGIAFGTTGVLGTLDNNSLDIYTQNAFRARFTPTGELLIGTNSNPGNSQLYVAGVASFGSRTLIGGRR